MKDTNFVFLVVIGSMVCEVAAIFYIDRIKQPQVPSCVATECSTEINESSMHLYVGATKVRHITGLIGYTLGHYSSRTGHLIVRRAGDQLIRERWYDKEIECIVEDPPVDPGKVAGK